ncbi:MAG: thrombospondin type 3 repeat-containing protein [Phycisphaerae bacterium]
MTAPTADAGIRAPAVSVLSLRMASCAVAQQSCTANGEFVIAALGDSLTDTPVARGPNHAEHITARLGVPLLNVAVSGATTRTLLEQGQHTQAIAAGATLAFLWIGGNDMLLDFTIETAFGDDSFVPDSIANWATAADALLDSGAVVITANIPDLSKLPGTVNLFGADLQPVFDNIRAVTMSFNAALQDAADERGIVVVDVFNLFDQQLGGTPDVCGVPVGLPPASGEPTDFFFDDIHPTSYAMGLITNEFITAMNNVCGTDVGLLVQAQLGGLAGLPECNVPDANLPPNPDSDSDGVPDAIDVCAGADDFADADADATPDCLDGCPGDPTKTEPGLCGCNVPETDTDGDGVADCIDNCVNTINPVQADADTDGIGDRCDNCPATPNVDQADADGDGVGDGCDNCGVAANVSQADIDADGIGDACDNCPDTANADQADADADGIGDACPPELAPTPGPTGGVPGVCGAGMINLLPLVCAALLAAPRRRTGIRRHTVITRPHAMRRE